MYLSIIAIALIFFGEVFAIGAEFYAAERISSGEGVWWHIFMVAGLLMLVGGAFLIGGYILGYLQLKNIWIVSAVSIGSILIVEPILGYVWFAQLPTTGALIGLVLGAIGMAAALLIP